MFTLCSLCSYFSDNQYPDEAKREEIANACNAVIQKPGRNAGVSEPAQLWLCEYLLHYKLHIVIAFSQSSLTFQSFLPRKEAV